MIDFILAYKAVKDQRRKQKAYKRLIGKEADYAIIQALIDQARFEVVATVTFKDGTKLDITRKDRFDQFQDFLTPEKAGSY